jgi:hypothetical protein
LKSGRIFNPENKNVTGDNHSVKQEQDLRCHCFSDHQMPKAGGLWNRAPDVPETRVSVNIFNKKCMLKAVVVITYNILMYVV